MTSTIPRIIHQTWRDAEIPEKWRDFQQSWPRHHPDWSYRLWTDLDLRGLIQECYPWFLSIYDNYPETIQRVDAARYFLLHRFGGVYADLDLECLRPLEPWVEDSLRERDGILLGLEPEAHNSKPVVASAGFERIVCNAFMASRPRHPFWERLFLRLVGAHRLPGPLLSTGPLLLTEAVAEEAPAISCISSEVLYPGTSEDARAGRLLDPRWRAESCAGAYTIHHWGGSWIPESPKPANPHDTQAPPEWAPVTVVNRGKPALSGDCRLEQVRADESEVPRVSCLTVTHSGRLENLKRAIACFQAQTHPSKELVIVDDSDGNELGEYLGGLGDSRIVHDKVPRAPLGTLRNRAVARARGELVIQWDDDDLYHPRRIELQLAALRATGSDACLLSRWQIWWPEQRRLAVSKKRGWEGSVLCARSKSPFYDPDRRRGEDTGPILRLASREKVVFLDAPWLYTYLAHGGNTTPKEELDRHWAQATRFHYGKDYARRLRAWAAELPESVRSELLSGLTREERTRVARPAATAYPAPLHRPTERPRILILTPVKDGARFVESYFSALGRLDYPAHRLSLALLESDSVDGTGAAVAKKLESCRELYARAELYKRDYRYRPTGSRSDSHRQLQRRSLLARSRNYLLSRALREEDWVLWLDFDVIDYPADTIDRLLSHEREIVVPHCVFAPGGRTFDLNTFVSSGAVPGSATGPLLQPERGDGRRYLESFRDRALVEVDAVGGTMLLVRADLHREGLIFPVTPYRRHIETEGLSFLARDMGVSSWGDPRLEVVHANH